MKYLIPVLVGAASIFAAITTAVASSEGAFAGHAPLTPYFWGYAASGILLAIATLLGILSSKREEPKLPMPISVHQENKQEQNVYVGLHDQKREQEELKLEEVAISFMRREHPARGYRATEIAAGLGIQPHEALAILDRLLKKQRVFPISGEYGNDGEIWMLEYNERSA